MACNLTQGFPIDCKNNVGGIKAVYIANKENIATIVETAGVVTTLTMDAGTDFYKYDQIKESSNFAETITTNVQNGTVFYAQTIEVILNKLQTNTRNEILLLSQATTCVIVEDNNGKYWLLGKNNGLDVTGGGSATGTAFGDRNGYTLTFAGSEPELATEVSSSVMASGIWTQ
jgi:formyltetrahydrofolate synthetase